MCPASIRPAAVSPDAALKKAAWTAFVSRLASMPTPMVSPSKWTVTIRTLSLGDPRVEPAPASVARESRRVAWVFGGSALPPAAAPRARPRPFHVERVAIKTRCVLRAVGKTRVLVPGRAFVPWARRRPVPARMARPRFECAARRAHGATGRTARRHLSAPRARSIVKVAAAAAAVAWKNERELA